MKIWKNLLEPHIPDLHTFSIHLSKVARFSYLFNLLLRIGQICILFQSPCQNLPDCHTFSIFSKFGRLALVNWAKFKKFHNLILKCLIPSEAERAAEARRAVVASTYKTHCKICVGRKCKRVWLEYGNSMANLFDLLIKSTRQLSQAIAGSLLHEA